MQREPGCRCCCVSAVCIAHLGDSEQKRELATGAQFSGIDRLAYNTHVVKSSLSVIPIQVCVMQPYTPRFLFSRFSQPVCRPTDQSLSHPIPRDAFVVVIFVVLTALLPHYKILFFKIFLLCPNLPRGCRWVRLLYTSLAL